MNDKKDSRKSMYKANPNILVSIITPNYNGAKYISQTIDSVISQTYKNWELIIIDDCSIDDSVELVNGRISEDPRIRLIKLSKNAGTVVARNTGIKAAVGNFIAFLDSDDQWDPEKLELQIKFMITNQVPFSFTSYIMVDPSGKVVGKHDAPASVSYSQLLYKCDIGCSTVIYNQEKLGKQFFNTKSPKAREDYVLWLSIAKKGATKMMGLQQYLMLYRKHEEGISANKRRAIANIWKVYRAFENLSLMRALYYITAYSFNGVKKHYLRPRLKK